MTAKYFERADLYHGDKLIRRGRPATGNAKRLVSLRVDQDVLQRLRASGPGWQTRVNDALRMLVDQSGET